MKKAYCLVLIFITAIGFTQNNSTLKASESVEFKDKVKSGEVVAMHTTNNNLTGIIRNSKKHLLFDVFDESLNRVKNLLIEVDKKEAVYGNLSFNNTMKVFSVLSPSKKERIVYCHEFNIYNGYHKKTKLFDVEVEKNRSIFSGGNKRETGFSMSPNGQYFVVSTDNVKKYLNSYTVHIYNSETLELVYKKVYQKDEEKFYEANDLSIDDNANVYSLGKLFIEGRKEKKDGKANYDFTLSKISKDSIVTEKIIVDKEEHISSLIISNINNEIKLMGFYSDERAGKIKGALIFNVDNENIKVTENKSFELPESVFKDLYNASKAKRKKDKGAELSSYYIDYVLEDSKGNTYLLAEEFFITQVYVSNGMNGGYWVTTYHYNNVLALKLNADGNLEWARSIFKRANTPSYNAFIKNDELHVILNSGKNLTEKDDGRVKVSKGWLESTSLYDIVFNEAGEVKYNKIQDNKGNTFYRPYYGAYTSERFITISRSGGKKQFLILE